MGRRGRPASGAPHDPCSHRRPPVPARLACRARLEDRRGRCGPLRGRDRRGRARAGADLTASLDELSERGGVRPGQRGHRSRRALRGRPRDHASRAARARGRRGGTGRRGLARDAVARDADRRGERQGAVGTARRRFRRARPGRVGGHAPAAHGRRRPRAVPRSSAGDRPAVVSRRVPSPVNATPRPATPAELDTVARVFAEALAPDPMITWPFPPATTVDDVTTLFQILLQHAYGSLGVIWVVSDERVEAAAAWLPPEQVSRFQEIEVATRPRIEALTDDGGGATPSAGTGWASPCRPSRAGSSTSSPSGRPLEAAGSRPRWSVTDSIARTAPASRRFSKPATQQPFRCTNTSGFGWSSAPTHPTAARRSGSSAQTPPRRTSRHAAESRCACDTATRPRPAGTPR